MHCLGIDWGVEQHGLCLLADDGRVLSAFSIPEHPEGYQALQDLLASLREVAINTERPDGLLVDWLVAHGYPVYVTVSNVVARRRPRRSKDDRGDAYLLANLLRTQDPECRPLVRQSPTIVHLRQLVKAYDDIVEELRRDATRLAWTLRKYFPAALEAFRSRPSLTSLAFLEAYPTPQAACELTRAGLVRFLRDNKYSQLYRLNHIYATLQAPFPIAFAQEGYVEAVQLIIPRLRCLIEQRKQVLKRIEALFKTHPDAAWWRGLPGASGPLTSARLLAAVGDNRQRFPSARVLQATAGTAPVTRRSGKQRRVEFRHACSKPLRKALDDFARYSVRYSGWAQAYFYEQLTRGHSRARAYRALGNRWLAIIWKLWQTGEPYDEVKHVASRSRRGQPAPV